MGAGLQQSLSLLWRRQFPLTSPQTDLPHLELGQRP